ncbi:hypothetical protein ACIRVF_38970 [Kitasatospora sp. NPDC101157]|uniref:hypothetical protein n=1 Tax=Kitasatospora sp. NPDC101157 TaxID=3364098 RepID=UPI00380E1EE2
MNNTAPPTTAPPGRPAEVPGRPAAAVGYVCAEPDDASAGLFANWCERRAVAEGWTLTGMVNDTDESQPLVERPGWQRVASLATGGALGAVITITRPMIGTTTQDWVRVSDQLADLDVTLVTVGSAARTPPSGDDQ